MGKLIIEEVLLPETSKGGGKKGSKYLTEDIKEAALVLGAQPQSFLIPAIEGIKPEKQKTQTLWYLNNWGKTLVNAEREAAPKAFIVKVVEGGIRVWLKA